MLIYKNETEFPKFTKLCSRQIVELKVEIFELMNKILYWSPRLLMILFILFISLFALDSFDDGNSFLEKTGNFMIHLIPTVLLIIILILSWRREWIGGITFFLLGILYIVMAWGNFPLSTYFVISGPLFIVAVLFLINWIKKEKTSINHT